jgi:alkylation response protein AidB-like acyl-CoA dehydrogenase
MSSVADRIAPFEDLASGLADGRGVPQIGRRAEHDRLRAAGARDLAWGRLYEGHVNALQLIARCGTDRQRERAAADVAAGRLFAVWNTQADDAVTIASAGERGVTLAGAKTFASGAGRVARAIVTARRSDGAVQMTLVPMDRVRVAIDPTFWRPYGMEASDSFAVDFTGVRLEPDDLIGAPDAYERMPWFGAGASRFVAVQTGAIDQLTRDLAAFLRRRGQHDDPLALERLGECAVGARAASLWTDACADAWTRYDATPSDANEAALRDVVDAARYAVERIALDVCERVERGAGARGLLETEPFARRLRDLRMYLRQPAIDATLLRVARAAIAPDPII